MGRRYAAQVEVAVPVPDARAAARLVWSVAHHVADVGYDELDAAVGLVVGGDVGYAHVVVVVVAAAAVGDAAAGDGEHPTIQTAEGLGPVACEYTGAVARIDVLDPPDDGAANGAGGVDDDEGAAAAVASGVDEAVGIDAYPAVADTSFDSCPLVSWAADGVGTYELDTVVVVVVAVVVAFVNVVAAVDVDVEPFRPSGKQEPEINIQKHFLKS